MVGTAEACYIFNSLIESCHSFCYWFCQSHIYSTLFGSNFYPSEAAAHSKIKTFHTSVDIIHTADDIDVFRHVEMLVITLHISVLSFDGSFYTSVSRVNTKKELSENFRDFASVDFVDYKNVVFVVFSFFGFEIISIFEILCYRY